MLKHVDHATKDAAIKFQRIWELGGHGFTWHRANRWRQTMVLKGFCYRPLCRVMKADTQ